MNFNASIVPAGTFNVACNLPVCNSHKADDLKYTAVNLHNQGRRSRGGRGATLLKTVNFAPPPLFNAPLA